MLFQVAYADKERDNIVSGSCVSVKSVSLPCGGSEPVAVTVWVSTKVTHVRAMDTGEGSPLLNPPEPVRSLPQDPFD